MIINRIGAASIESMKESYLFKQISSADLGILSISRNTRPLAAIVGPNINGIIVQLSGRNYQMIMAIGPLFMLLAFIMMIGVRRGEAKVDTA